MKKVARDIEIILQNQLQPEVPSYRIGELVMERLKEVDEVAYVRFASVYREFKDINTFMNELKTLMTDKKSKPPVKRVVCSAPERGRY
jgi:transcriptional repressor NrdR